MLAFRKNACISTSSDLLSISQIIYLFIGLFEKPLVEKHRGLILRCQLTFCFPLNTLGTKTVSIYMHKLSSQKTLSPKDMILTHQELTKRCFCYTRSEGSMFWVLFMETIQRNINKMSEPFCVPRVLSFPCHPHTRKCVRCCWSVLKKIPFHWKHQCRSIISIWYLLLNPFVFHQCQRMHTMM